MTRVIIRSFSFRARVDIKKIKQNYNWMMFNLHSQENQMIFIKSLYKIDCEKLYENCK